MTETSRHVWLGFSSLGMRVHLKWEEILAGVVALGRGADSVASLLALSIHRTGRNVLVVDLSGTATRELSGHLPAFESSYILKDAFKLEQTNSDYHGRLIASALSACFGLTSGQESFLSSVMSKVAAEEGYASPSGALDKIGLVAGYKTTDKQEVQGRLGNLHLLDATGELGSIQEITCKSCIVSCAAALTPELSDASAAYLLAKMLARLHNGEALPDAMILTDAHRIFRSQRYAGDSKTFQSAMSMGRMGKVFSSELAHQIEDGIVQSCSVRISSGSVIHANQREADPLLPGMLMFRNIATDEKLAFAPRNFEPKTGKVKVGQSLPLPPTDLTRKILETISSSVHVTRTSVAAWLSTEYEVDLVLIEVDRLVKELFLASSSSDMLRGGPAVALELTSWGEAELKRLRGDGEASDTL